MSKRQEYEEAVKSEFADASREELLRQIAFCWKRIDESNTEIYNLKYELKTSDDNSRLW